MGGDTPDCIELVDLNGTGLPMSLACYLSVDPLFAVGCG